MQLRHARASIQPQRANARNMIVARASKQQNVPFHGAVAGIMLGMGLYAAPLSAASDYLDSVAREQELLSIVRARSSQAAAPATLAAPKLDEAAPVVKPATPPPAPQPEPLAVVEAPPAPPPAAPEPLASAVVEELTEAKAAPVAVEEAVVVPAAVEAPVVVEVVVVPEIVAGPAPTAIPIAPAPTASTPAPAPAAPASGNTWLLAVGAAVVGVGAIAVLGSNNAVSTEAPAAPVVASTPSTDVPPAASPAAEAENTGTQ
ncbi:hypothetical protein Vretimale_4174 [Volvox reticuliferus]|uniref:Uncharacterized protein n=1 Tax=Volvox reticuliferus TaxID=1737510 RepID=A0A8J4BZ71_9CHLO|nr:hypothetical protein Vretifemale_2825 [Volvox reticuliferus]GIL98949.1 hypothetical protein Vretimale_4174 [Volvox reticuliferus]